MVQIQKNALKKGIVLSAIRSFGSMTEKGTLSPQYIARHPPAADNIRGGKAVAAHIVFPEKKELKKSCQVSRKIPPLVTKGCF